MEFGTREVSWKEALNINDIATYATWRHMRVPNVNRKVFRIEWIGSGSTLTLTQSALKYFREGGNK